MRLGLRRQTTGRRRLLARTAGRRAARGAAPTGPRPRAVAPHRCSSPSRFLRTLYEQAEMGSVKDDPHKPGSSVGHSLEIFLFSNGQRDSPPRKYNVRVDDRCDITLSFLARSQNGSEHNIELYTTDGKKIRRAQELGNGATYVAVEPPQAFISSGYNDYLMKASRHVYIYQILIQKIRVSNNCDMYWLLGTQSDLRF
ncbi:uncharacterized protein LOC134660654 [Cydia amplana]|uniref:uncharacterized protein LOC134660654 n=1 Tax=Cydia amplana TaxID=1869771 RepID=UPI002FE69EF6